MKWWCFDCVQVFSTGPLVSFNKNCLEPPRRDILQCLPIFAVIFQCKLHAFCMPNHLNWFDGLELLLLVCFLFPSLQSSIFLKISVASFKVVFLCLEYQATVLSSKKAIAVSAGSNAHPKPLKSMNIALFSKKYEVQIMLHMHAYDCVSFFYVVFACKVENKPLISFFWSIKTFHMIYHVQLCFCRS